MGSPLADLGIPWIWGPIGGGERFPWGLLGILSPVAAGFELFRELSTKISMLSPAVRRAVRDAALILPNNPETEYLLIKLGADPAKMKRLVQSFLPKDKLERLHTASKQDPKTCGVLKIVAGGNLEGRKGVAIALGALALLKNKGIPFRYRYLGKGPEAAHLNKLSEKLGLSSEVEFCDSLRGDEYIQALQDSHIYLLPSLREGVPLTQMEAMAAGCVPVVADCGGAGPMARAAGCDPIAVSLLPLSEQAISQKILQLWNNDEAWAVASSDAMATISLEYSSEYYSGNIRRFYDEVAGFPINGLPSRI
jgi:glycosyltransferase involved in cell wall biosynthesis